MNHFSADALVNMFSPLEIIAIIEEGIKKHAEGKYKVPERLHISRGESTNLIMPAFGEDFYCTKLISVDPKNNAYNLPIISGLLVLNNSKTGETIATMDAPMVTALRTAAVGSIGLDLICRENIRKLGIIGLGVQGFWQTIFAASIRNIDKVHCHSRSKDKFLSYCDNVKKWFPHITIEWCEDSESVVQLSDVVITCTTSNNPVFNPENIDISNKRFISVGSFSKDMQELPSGVYRQSDALIIDSEAAKNEVGDVINCIDNNWIASSNIHTLAEISLKEKIILDYKNIVFKSVGMAAFDLALAAAVYNHFSKK